MPLGELAFSQFVELVVERDVRPERPDNKDAPQLSDKLWELAEKCWVKDPKSRPTASAVCATLSHLLDAAAITPLTPVRSSSHIVAIPQSAVPSDSAVQPTPPRPLTPIPNASPIVETTSVAQPIPDPVSSEPIPQLVGQPDSLVQNGLQPTSSLSHNLTFQGHTDRVSCAA